MIYAFYILNLVLLLAILLQRLHSGVFGFYSGILIGTLYMVMIPLGLLLLQGELFLPLEFSGTMIVDPVSVSNYSSEIWLLLALVISVISVNPLLKAKSQPVYEESYIGSINDKYRFLCIYSLVIYLATSIYLAVGSGVFEGGHWAVSKEEFVSESGVVGLVLGALVFASRLLFAASLVLLYAKEVIGFRIFLLSLAMFIPFELYFTGNRIVVLQTAILLGSVLVAQRNYQKLALLAIVAIPVGLIMNLFRYIRPFMHESFSVDSIVSAYQKAEEISLDSGWVDFVYGITEAVNMHVLLDVLKEFTEEKSLLLGETLSKVLFFAVPRSLWADKPESIATIVGDIYIPGSGVSLVTTFFGEFYANFGIVSLFLIPATVLVLVMTERFSARDRMLWSMLTLVYGFTMIRMPVSDVIVYLVVTVLLVRSETVWKAFPALAIRFFNLRSSSA